jgi:flavin reductase (DIM6/NTAB) family NADH-FMN oxidoreductase RutF
VATLDTGAGMSQRLSSDLLRRAYGTFPSGVTAVCALIGGEPCGLAASSFTSVSLDPALVSVCVRRESSTWPRLRPAPRLGVSILSAGHQQHALALAGSASDRFRDLAWDADDQGAVLVAGAAARLTCRLEAELEAGDHLIALLRVETVEMTDGAAPLVFHASRFRTLAEPA